MPKKYTFSYQHIGATVQAKISGFDLNVLRFMKIMTLMQFLCRWSKFCVHYSIFLYLEKLHPVVSVDVIFPIGLTL